MITRHDPTDWKDLQNQVGRILAECGLDTQVEHTVDTVRGSVELDVHATETIKRRTWTIVCECKHWQKAVPQTVVHAFRTVVADIGANVGYIVSRNGFQAGSYHASDLTNIRLVTWSEFLAEFEETWLEKFFAPELVRQLDPLFTYTEPLLPPWYSNLSNADQDKYRALKERYDLFGIVLSSLAPWAQLIPGDEPVTLPLRAHLVPPHPTIPDDILDEPNWREFLEASVQHGLPAIAAFRVLRDRGMAESHRDR
jgi:restriction system protein